ncbi:START domain-containing protein [Pseudoalteromonas byunsanensis]|uniref:START domain-containing protein n=1 Tax=Pseudoalteromonas byunsanensis TaxID=327939 RepID=A0A1S1N9G1_9GAMM|nr:START domain-containing protein [Pseudoalteromonas byunsanensis]OHU96004.1 hypothetical protein BIW53_09390 [Pseudoalteromonas byunsanensis]
MSRLQGFASAALILVTSFSANAEKLVRDKNDIKVFVSEEQGENIKRFRGVTIVPAKLSALTALLHDLESAHQWIHALESVDVIEPYSPDFKQYTSYSIISTPWPTQDRDNVVFNQTYQDSVSKVVTVTMQSKSDLMPKTKKYVRIPKFEGYWQFIPVSEAETKVVFSALSDPGGSVPSFIYNSMIEDAPYYTLLNLRKMMPLESEYTDKQYAYIEDFKEVKGHENDIESN